jgi:hypothetical protein
MYTCYASRVLCLLLTCSLARLPWKAQPDDNHTGAAGLTMMH